MNMQRISASATWLWIAAILLLARCSPALGAGKKCLRSNGQPSGVCGKNAVCTDTTTSYSCTCQPGYYPSSKNAKKPACKDFNECLTASGQDSNICGPDRGCINLPGKYSCTDPVFKDVACVTTNPCAPLGRACEASPSGAAQCAGCLDSTHKLNIATGACEAYNACDSVLYNDCTAKRRPCIPGATSGSYTCGACYAGFEDDPAASPGSVCRDKNECLPADANPCKALNRQCQNLFGSYSCAACASGFEQDPATGPTGKCKEIPNSFPCEANNGCEVDKHKQCLAITNGAEVCGDACVFGYKLASPGNPKSDCIDIDECKSKDMNDCDEQHRECVNSDGDFGCGACLPNWTRPEGKTDGPCSVDKDECKEPDNECALLHVPCTNFPDGRGYSCATNMCLEGYERSAGTCTDVNECERPFSDKFPNVMLANCSADAVCANFGGGYNCTCKEGFRDVYGDGKVCENIDECATGWNLCDANALCFDTKGSYACACYSGFEDTSGGYGFSCVQVGSPLPLVGRRSALDASNASAPRKLLEGRPAGHTSHVMGIALHRGE